MRPTLQSITLDVDGMTVTGIRQFTKEAQLQPRLLCLHGWLDNANSFVPMMPYLPAFDMIAVDLPGHGYSDPLTKGYQQAEVMVHVVKIMQALDWNDCHLIGHSMGGCIAPLIAVATPERIQSMTLIEAAGPLSEKAEALPERLGRALQDRLTPEKYASRTFASKDEAVAARLKAAKMHTASAKLIIDRQVIEDEDGLRWRFDPALRMASYQYQTEEQVHAILSAISCPTLSVVANQGYLATRNETAERLAQIRHHTTVSLTGHHHLHMDTPEPVAAAINQFLGTTPALGG